MGLQEQRGRRPYVDIPLLLFRRHRTNHFFVGGCVFGGTDGRFGGLGQGSGGLAPTLSFVIAFIRVVPPLRI